MKGKTYSAVAAILIIAFMISVSGCFGSFELTKKVYKFNKGLGDKWVQEVGFLVMYILPVYGIAALADLVILNTIEFWSGSNPIASNLKSDDGTVQVMFNKQDGTVVLNQEGTEYILEKTDNGTTVKDRNGKVVVQCQAQDDGGIILKDANGKIIGSYTKTQVQNFYSLLGSAN